MCTFTHSQTCMQVIYPVNNTAFSLSSLALYWFPHFKVLRGLVPQRSIDFLIPWEPFSSLVHRIQDSLVTRLKVTAHILAPPPSGTPAMLISSNLVPSHLIKILHLLITTSLPLLSADLTPLNRAATGMVHFIAKSLVPLLSLWYLNKLVFKKKNNQQAVPLHANQNTHDPCKLFVAASRHHLPDCPRRNTTWDLWHLVCIHHPAPLCPHTLTNTVHLMNIFMKPVLIDTLWTGWGGRWCGVNTKQQQNLDEQQKHFHNTARGQKDTGPAIQTLRQRNRSPQSRLKNTKWR